ncbi:MAG: nuclear transport factor 2 family protein [Sphingobium sp.]
MPRTRADDRDAIVRQVYAYCRSVDRMDVELGYSIWHEDGEADYGALFRGSGRGLIDWATQAHAVYISQFHQVSNVSVILDGDKAASESYVTAALRSETDGLIMQTTICGRYVDRWSCRHNRWAIDKRVYLHDFDEIRETTSSRIHSPAQRDRSDPSYAILDI